MKYAGFVSLLILSSTWASPLLAQPTPLEPSQTQAERGTENPYDFFMRQGYAAAKDQDYESASRYFRNALFEVPNDQDALTAYWNMQDALRPQDEPTAAPSDYDRYMEIGYDATETGDYQTALINFKRALRERTDDYYATQAMRNVKTYIDRGQSSSVTTAPKFYLNELPYDRYMRVGYAAMQREDYQAAAQQFRSALDIRPDDRQALIAFWNVMDVLDQGPKETRQGQSESLYDRLMRRGYDATEAKAYSKALDYFQRALNERPEDYYATQAIRNLSSYLSSLE